MSLPQELIRNPIQTLTISLTIVVFIIFLSHFNAIMEESTESSKTKELVDETTNTGIDTLMLIFYASGIIGTVGLFYAIFQWLKNIS